MQKVGFPMARLFALFDDERPLIDGDAVFDVFHRTMRTPGPAAPAFGAGQIVPPAIIVGAGKLSIDEAIDGFMSDAHASFIARQPAYDLFGRQSHSKSVEDE